MAYLTSKAVSRKQLITTIYKYVRDMPRQEKIAFHMKYLIYCVKMKDWEAAMDGLEMLFKLNGEYANNWRVCLKTYDDDEGGRINYLFNNILYGTDKAKR